MFPFNYQTQPYPGGRGGSWIQQQPPNNYYNGSGGGYYNNNFNNNYYRYNNEANWQHSPIPPIVPLPQLVTPFYNLDNGGVGANGENLSSSTLTVEDDAGESEDGAGGGVLIYIDNSNIWINTMERSAKNLKFRNDIQQDQRTRVNINKLMSTAAAGRPIIRAVLYGSEPPPVSKFWNNVKENKFCKVDVQVTRRSTYTNREREVDQNIMLDIGEDIVIHQNHAKHGGTVILFTGDGGMIAAVKRALKYGWNVEIWAYDSSLAKDYKDEAQKDEKFTIKKLDDYFDDIVFYTNTWKSPIPRERSFVITFLRKIPDDKKPEVLEIFVKAITELVRMPMAGRYLKDGDGERSKQTHLAIVCSVGKLILKEDSRSDTYKSESDHQSYRGQNHHNHINGNNNGHPSTLGKISTFKFTSEKWDQVPSVLGLPFLKEGNDFNTRVKAEFENLVQEALKTNSHYLDNPKYDFNGDVYHKVENVLCVDKLAELVSPTDMSQDLKEGLENIIQRFKPELRSLLQFLQDMRLEDYPDVESQIECPANEDDGEGGYTVQTGRKTNRRKFQKYSQECKYSFRCVNGFRCGYNHSDKEKEFFKIQPDPKLRSTYKFKPCDHFQNNKCKYKRAMSYMCPFSHGYFCFSCKCDEDGGHSTTCTVPLVPMPHSLSESDAEHWDYRLYRNGVY